jgi:PAS domain S-box-containing protein
MLSHGPKFSSEESMRNQEKAVEAEFKYEELQHSSLIGIITFDKEFIIQKANSASAKILKRKSKDFIGKHFSDYIAQQYKKSFDSYLKKIQSTKTRQDHTFQLKKEDGRDLYIILESFPIINARNEIDSIRSIIIDITEQKNSDLKHQTELIKNAVESMLDPFVILTPERDEYDRIIDFVYTYVNSEAEKANNLSREDTIGKRLTELFPNFIGSNMFNNFIKVAETGEPIMKEGVYMEFAAKHQTIKGIFHTRINRLNDEIIVTYRDITEKSNAEVKLNALISELERSNKELEQFAYVASHDLQEPLRMVTQFTKLLSERYKDKSDPKSEEYISFILDGANRMIVLLKDLLKYARVSSQAKPFEITDVNKVLAEVLTDLNLLISDSKAEINVSSLPKLMADPVQMRQLFQNLIENAIKFRNESKLVINISVEKKMKDWVFSVSDNGIGIDPRFSESIFMIFQRLHDREKYAGSGVGLAICKRIVERHNGRIWVESEEGKGSTFYFTIPVNS